MFHMADERTDLPEPLHRRWKAARQAVATTDAADWSTFLDAHPDVLALADAIVEHYHETGRPFD